MERERGRVEERRHVAQHPAARDGVVLPPELPDDQVAGRSGRRSTRRPRRATGRSSPPRSRRASHTSAPCSCVRADTGRPRSTACDEHLARVWLGDGACSTRAKSLSDGKPVGPRGQRDARDSCLPEPPCPPFSNSLRMRRRRPCGAPRPARRRCGRRAPSRTSRRAACRSVRPSPPCTWIARSMTSFSTRAASNLMTEISTRASSPASILCAASSVISRQAWMSAAESAIQFWIVCLSASREPNASRSSARVHSSSKARCIWPSQRMTWWIRPGPEPLLRDAKAVARLAERVLDGHSDAGVRDLAVRRPAAPAVAENRHGRDLDPFHIGRDDDLRRPPVRLRVRVGDGHEDREGGALRAAREPLVSVDHPLVAVAHGAGPQRRRVGARRPPARSSRRTSAPRRRRAARSQRRFCSSVPNRCRISPLPASGAWHPKTSCAQTARPISSFRYA